ncbi:MAG: protein of unknown function transrane [Acidimicrobiales bacterium]|nr:protein of unknown function transrane [Acidimicrobiales bacterium]
MLALAVAGFLFGSTFLVVQGAIERADVLPFLAVRFLIGAAVLSPLARRRPASRHEVRHGVLAGGCLLAGYILQTVGLRSTTSATSAFITYLLVVLVPVIAVVRTRRAPAPHIVVGVSAAVAGLGLLSGGASGLGRGELLTVGAALAFAVHIVVLGEVAGRHDPIRFTLWQVLTVGGACAVPGALSGGGYRFDGGVWLAAAFCGVFATAAAFWCMTYGQRVVPGSQAAIILLLEPVSAGVLGEVTGEHLGARGLLGAGLILGAVLVSELGGPAPPAPGTELAATPDGAAGRSLHAMTEPAVGDAASPGAAATEPGVVVPAGLPFAEAAGWVGQACWSELRVHEALTGWLAVEADEGLAATLWVLRAHRAELAELWHRRLPELREFPRQGFVLAGDVGTDGLAVLTEPGTVGEPVAGTARVAALASALTAMAERYRAHLAVAVGPADGPVADTLRLALARTESDLTLLPAR